MVSPLFVVTMPFGVGTVVWNDRDGRGMPVRIQRGIVAHSLTIRDPWI